MRSQDKFLLVRADFVLGNRPGGDRLSCKRWRRLLCEVLPRLMGCGRRCPKAIVRLHDGEGEAHYTAWLRLPIERRPGRKRLRQFKANLRARLEAGLLLIAGRVLKVGVRRRVAQHVSPVILAGPNFERHAPGQLELFDPLGFRDGTSERV